MCRRYLELIFLLTNVLFLGIIFRLREALEFLKHAHDEYIFSRRRQVAGGVPDYRLGIRRLLHQHSSLATLVVGINQTVAYFVEGIS